MKLNRLRRKFLNIVFTPLLVLLIGCSEEVKEVGVSLRDDFEDENTDEYTAFLVKVGYNREDIGTYPFGMSVENDILFPSWYLDEWIKKERNINKRHRSIRSCLPSSSVVQGIRYHIHSSVPSNWRSASYEAISEWEDLGAWVELNEVSSQSATRDLLITTVNWPSVGWNAAATWLPANCSRVGSIIYINLAKHTGTQKATMMHEIGHIIGLEHTNGGAAGHFIEESCVHDTYSIMNNPIVTPNELFTQCDIDLIESAWGDGSGEEN